MKKKTSKKDLLRQWGLPEKFQWRGLAYKQPYQKGIYWYWFSLFIRQRDVEKYGTCVSCGKPIGMYCDAGHFMPAGDCGRDLIFDPRNVNAECKGCNAFDKTHLLGYAQNLDKRYGAGTAQELRDRRQAYKDSKTPVKDFSGKEYEELIKKLPSFTHKPLGGLAVNQSQKRKQRLHAKTEERTSASQFHQ